MTVLLLQGVRVLDLSQMASGPFAGMLLGDLGADVIKVEPPQGDSCRIDLGPPFQGGEGTYFLAVNRNKRGVVLDLQRPEGLQAFYRLVETADVLIHNFRPGVAEKLQIDYPRLSARNEALIYCSISGFGETGPYAARPGLDLVFQGMGGLMSVTGEPDGPPERAGAPVADMATGCRLYPSD
ncbi:MAG: CoA transferase, partial [Clostridia bacterium]|nr:CoA transferase [Clostridia bacterium]